MLFAWLWPDLKWVRHKKRRRSLCNKRRCSRYGDKPVFHGEKTVVTVSLLNDEISTPRLVEAYPPNILRVVAVWRMAWSTLVEV